MRVFLDSNVLVSAFGTRGLSADVLRLVLTEHELLCAEVVLEEVERVLAHIFRMPAGTVAEIVSFLRLHPVEPRPAAPAPVPAADPDDAWILASAAGAEILVTGDANLLRLDPEAAGLRILNPRGFWELHRGSRP